MNREIKFRAWDKDNELMSRPFEIWEAKDILTGVYMTHTIRDPKTFLPVLMQYTGLKDKNGKEIYEGDVVKMDNWNPPLNQVKFIEGAFCLAFLKGDFAGEYAGDIHYIHHAGIDQAEVIGNIYENPEFLNPQRD